MKIYKKTHIVLKESEAEILKTIAGNIDTSETANVLGPILDRDVEKVAVADKMLTKIAEM